MCELSYCCPRCHGTLDRWTERYECRDCGALYPIVAGIPDFRLYPDPYIDLEADRAKGVLLAEEAGRLPFAELVARYYSITPEVLPAQARRFQAHHQAGVERGDGMLARLRAYRLPLPGKGERPVLDLGCGTAGFVAAAAAAGSPMVGVDIAFRWLVVGRRRLADLGREDVQLVCACADHLPFVDGTFGLIVAENLIEHTHAPGAVLAEAGRVRHGAPFMARTVNRFAPAPEPHVGLWGVGFLPRRLMDSYVRRFRGIPYKHIHLQSHGSLRRLLRASGQADLRVRRPVLVPADFAHHPPRQRQLFRWYTYRGDHVPAARPALAMFGPYLDVIGPTRR